MTSHVSSALWTLQTYSASQNNRLNLSFVKDTYGNAEKIDRKGGKMLNYESQILGLTLYVLSLDLIVFPIPEVWLWMASFRPWIAWFIFLINFVAVAIDFSFDFLHTDEILYFSRF